MKKILITGTHFTPAQAVIEELKKREDVEIVYLGRSYTREGDKTPSIESQVLPRLGVRFIPITTGRLQRAFTRYTIPSLFKIPIGLFQSFYYIWKERPDVVLSFGGYVAVPVVISAWLLRIPILVHEQTLVSGLANTISGFFANKIAVSFPADYQFPKNKLVVTGNPIREEVLNPKGKLSSEIEKIFHSAQRWHLPIILITGGNQGSHIINEVIYQLLEKLTDMACIIHQTGDSKFQDYERLYNKSQRLNLAERYYVAKWIDGKDFGLILKKIDLCISRAGINTLLELAYWGVPTILIPIPYLHKNEQVKNAQKFQQLGLAEVIPQEKFKADVLMKTIRGMLNSLSKWRKQARQASQVVIPNAQERLVAELEKIW